MESSEEVWRSMENRHNTKSKRNLEEDLFAFAYNYAHSYYDKLVLMVTEVII